MPTFSPVAVELVKEFEGLELTAYPDPGTGGEPWTIGHGRAHGVKPWDMITIERAEEMLVEDLETAVDALDLVKVELPQSVVDALTSFVFNVGEGAFGQSTLLRRLNAGEPIGPVLEQELPRWNKGGSGVLPGLVRRRDAEVALALSGLDQPPAQESPAAGAISLIDAATYYKGLDHQIEAFDYLESLLSDEELEEFARLYRSSSSSERILKVRAQFQLDNGPEGYRQCFTSSCAMLLDYLQPGLLSDENGDLDYLVAVERYGDTTDAAAQVQALRSFGIDCDFITTGSFEVIEQQIAKGFPVPVGWLHKGHVSAPSGGGHWSVIVGIEGENLVVCDPFGEAALVAGGYVSNAIGSGAAVRYSRKNFGPRWEVEGPGTGWMILAK